MPVRMGLGGESVAITLVEVTGRAEQGITRPYICAADDGDVYFVKGKGTGRRGQICEWVCAQLAQALGLPVAHSVLAEVPAEFIDTADAGWLSDLGRGTVFASRRVVAAEFASSYVNDVPLELRRDVFAFDWWVKNGDRSLSVRGGNPNLLWRPEGDGEGKLTVIDHNLAFDPAFNPSEFVEFHAFGSDITYAFSDFLTTGHYRSRFREVLHSWPRICASIPQEWFFLDDEMTLPIDFSTDEMLAILNQAFEPTFWHLPR